MKERYPNFIGKREELLDERIEVRNPADVKQVVATVPKAGTDQVNAAVDAAEEAFNGDWSDMKNSRSREKAMRKAVALVERDKAELARIFTMEQGKPLAEAASEIESFLNTMDYYAGFGGKLFSRGTKVKMGSGYLHVEDEPFPVGVEALIPPWNFPVSLLGWKIAPALICGNAVVVKPSGSTPLVTIEIVERIRDSLKDSGFDEGAVNVITGSSSVIGDALVSHRKVRKVFFTGSTDTGLHVYQKAATGIKSVTLELGGSDPTIVCDDADLESAASDIVFKGRFRNAGQSCTSVKRLFVFERVYDEFVKKVKGHTSSIRVGDGLNEGVSMGPLHNAPQRESIKSLVEDAKSRGADIALGGSAIQGDGYFFEPTLIENVPDEARIWKEEAFGPALPIRKVRDFDEAIELANNTRFGLGACIWTNDLTRQRKFLDRIESGIRWINSPPLSVPEISFGGVKESGTGRELGMDALHENLEYRSSRTLYR